MVGSFDLGGRVGGFLGPVVKQGFGERAADAPVEENEHGGDADAFFGESVAVRPTGPLEQAVGFHLAQIIADWGEGIGLWGESKGIQNGLANLGRPPTVELRTSVQQHLHQAQHAGVLNLDAGDLAAARGEGQSQPLKQGEVDVDVEHFGFKASEAIRRGDQPLTQGGQILQPLAEGEIFHAVDADLQAEEGGELFVQARQRALAIQPLG